MADKQEIELMKRVYNELRLARTAPKQWISGKGVAKLTGWNNATLHQARENGTLIYQRKKDGGIVYELQSVMNIPKELHTHKKATA